jgi:hypothetical protein
MTSAATWWRLPAPQSGSMVCPVWGLKEMASIRGDVLSWATACHS